MFANLYPFAYKVAIPSHNHLDDSISLWLAEYCLKEDIDYEYRLFRKIDLHVFIMNWSTFIFDDKDIAILFKLTFGGVSLESN